MAERLKAWLAAWLCAALASVVTAATAPATASPSQVALEERVTSLTAELRCLVCQNQTIADSSSELALQLKHEVRAQLARGDTDDQVRRFMVQRYGDFVLYRPPVTWATGLLWGGPAVLLALGMLLLGGHWRERRTAFTDAPDSGFTEDVSEGDRP